MLWFKPRKELTEESLNKRLKWLMRTKSVLYYLITVILAVLLLVQGIRCILKYVSEPTYMSNTIETQFDTDFPSISICPWGPYYKEDVLQGKYNMSGSADYSKISKSHPELRWQDASGRDIFEDITHSLDDLISEVQIRFLKTSNDSSLSGFPKISKLSHKVKHHRKFGKCFSLRFSDHAQGRGVYYAKLKLKSSVKIYAHAEDQFLDLSGRMGYELSLGETTKLQVNYQTFNSLPEVKGRSKCSLDSYDDCMYDSMKARMMDRYGCLAPWIPHNSSARTCRSEADKRGVYQIIYNRLNDCLDPCHYMIVNVGGKTVIPTKENDTHILLYFAHRVPVTQEYYLYEFLSLLAEIGGYCGLFMGYSAFHLAVFVGKMFNTAISDYEKRFHKQNEKRQSIPM